MSSTSGGGAGKGAAEEPEPEPGDASPPSSSATSASSDPRAYLAPHADDDRGGADGKPAKGNGGKAKTKTTGGAKEAKEGDAQGAAEESEPGPAASAAATASYDPRDYQPPHPDDRAGADGKATKKGAGGKAKPSKGKEVGAKGKEDTHRCANCDAPGAKMKCGRCGVERYCDRDCQKVRWPSG